MAKLRPITQHDYLVTIGDLAGYWSKFSGVEETADDTQYSDGLNKRNRTVLGPLEIEHVTLEKPFDPINDEALVSAIQGYRYNDTELTVTIEPVRRTPNGPERRGSRKITLMGCQIVTFTGFEVDTESSDVSMLELELSVDEWKYD